MSVEKATSHLKEFGLEDKIMLFDVSSATVAEAAQAIGCKEAEIAKSLSFLIDEKPGLVVAAGDGKIDNGKFKAFFHTKAKMLPFESVEPLIGHGVGGVCPFGINDGVAVYLDVSLKRFETVYPACGNAASAVKLTLGELEKASRYIEWVDVCKPAE
ncbi:MAG: YbaK/EbsC family protein [Clostridia bacterium]|nr:YbaK/EbsC family protein [Clostridia bacterium]